LNYEYKTNNLEAIPVCMLRVVADVT